MDEQTLAIMDAMAEKIEALTERVYAAEKKLTGQCSCKTWQERTQLLQETELGNNHAD